MRHTSRWGVGSEGIRSAVPCRRFTRGSGVNAVPGTRKRWDDVDETDVLIAGATPAGLALALDLERRGVRCLVLETGDGQAETPEVSPIGPRSMELFRRWGVAEKIRCAEFPGARPPDIAWVTQVG